MVVNQAPGRKQTTALMWGEFHLSADEARLTIGNLQLAFRQDHDELWLAHNHCKAPLRKTLTPSGRSQPWSRWIIGDGDFRVRLVPRMPDRPLIVKPEYAFKLLPNAKAQIYVQIPLWIQIDRGSFRSPFEYLVRLYR